MNKTAVVTGGSDGIGKALVLELAKNGYSVITCGRSKEKLAELSSNENISTVIADLTDQIELDAFLEFITNSTQTIDLLVNNAGVQIGNALLTDSSFDNIHAMFDIHVKAPLFLVQKLHPLFTGGSHIINIVSVVVKNYLKETYGPYTITKYAQYGMGNMLVKELAKESIKVTNVILGGANTSIREEERPHYLSPNDVAQAIVKVTEFPAAVYSPEVFLSPQSQL